METTTAINAIGGIGFGNLSVATFDDGTKIESFYLSETDNTIVLIKRRPSNMILACNPPRPAPDSVWKEIYGVEDGKIKLLKTIQGNHTPGKFVEEKIEFQEE